jgi:fumarylacetoacetate (FAA) hydrolase
MFTPRELALERGWPGRIEGDRVIQLAAQTIQSFFTGGGTAREHAEYALADVDLRPPVLHPPAVRDFMAFEEHVGNARKLRGAEVPKEWYEIPVFYFSNTAAIYGPDADVPYPEGTEELDYELECAAIIGAEGKIGGFTVLNDWSARDVQRAEMRVGLGPAKGKDFATSLGPLLVTPEELPGFGSGRPQASMTASVNGVEWSRGELADIHFPWGDLVAHAARDAMLRPGDLLGSGTVGTGCILELAAVHGTERYPWLRPGDVVELEVQSLGALRNHVGARDADG